MGSYLNPSSEQFKKSLRDEIYVDKSNLIVKTNAVFGTHRAYICLSRPRRFGKSMAADMLAAYYGRGEDTSALFEPLMISASPSYSEHLGQHDVIKINMQEFLSFSDNGVEGMLTLLQDEVLRELKEAYPSVDFGSSNILAFALRRIYAWTGRPFVIIIDEWDCVFREKKTNVNAQEKYLDYLRALLKDQAYVGLVYMTGILPIKKYGSHSALNMFDEYSMVSPGEMAEFFGFTETEVQNLCVRYGMSFEEAKAWYDGYTMLQPQDNGIEVLSMYNPNSVVRAMLRRQFAPYWNNTETYEALKVYICMNEQGLKDAIIQMLTGADVRINTGTFKNDMTSLNNRNDILTLLAHLGYLTYDFDRQSVSIPNREVSQEFVNAISTTGWSEVIRSVEASRKLMESLWNLDEPAIAAGIDQAHESVSILQYNDENALSYTIGLAFYFANEYYTVIREMPSGKGYADVVFIPRKLHADKPAVVIELKFYKSAGGAIEQIKEKHYPAALREYHGNLLLCGINYDKESKAHECRIERLEI